MSRFRRCFLSFFISGFLLFTGCAGKERSETEVMDYLNDYGQIEKRIAGLSIKDMEGRDVVLESIWEQKCVVLVFLRHFG